MLRLRAFNVVVLVLGVAGAPVAGLAQGPARQPLDVARVLAARYPEDPGMTYISGLAWAGAYRLAELTGETRWLEKPRQEMRPFLTGEREAIAEPHLLTSLAGHLAFADAGAADGDPAADELARQAADFILPESPDEIVRFPRTWTDDMFMATSVLARVAAQTGDARYGRAVGRLLTTYAERLQRPDGVFIHAEAGPHTWGRGNGFAGLGLTEALTYLPETWNERSRVLDIYRRFMRGMLTYQSEDGSWRQVIDQPTAYHELTVTAMTVASMARGVRLGWLDRAEFMPVVERGWQAVVDRVNVDGTLEDVCTGTGAQATLEYYMNRPTVNGADDRGGAMALLAALEMAELQRSSPPATTGVPTYEVYAVRYATLPGYRVSGLVAGADPSRRMDLAMMVWLIQGAGGRTVLMDAGFSSREDLMERWHPLDYTSPEAALDRLGVAPEDVTDVIVSHIHWDHFDGIDLFPNARVWIQGEESEHHVDPDGQVLDRAIDPIDAAKLQALRTNGRLELVEGDGVEIIPGITVHTGGKHTFQSQCAAVQIAGGEVVLASDNAYLYENLEQRLAIAQTLDAASNLAAQARMLTLASEPRLVVPGHDPAVFTRFETVAPGVVRIR